jgi:hypothetical protein
MAALRLWGVPLPPNDLAHVFSGFEILVSGVEIHSAMGTRRRLADRQCTRHNFCPVERLNGSLSALSSRHRDDCKTERPTALAVDRQIDLGDVPVCGAQTLEVGLGGSGS